MIYNFNYLKDKNFLKKFDKQKLKQQYVRLNVLTRDEKPIQQIQGKVLGGSFSFDGSSGMRRTGNLSMIAEEDNKTFELLQMNKKIEVLTGFLNTTDEYPQYPILWFPMGIYVIISLNIVHDENGVNISLGLHDKMALLNGGVRGKLPASVIFSQREDIDENGQTQIIQPTIYQIIQQLVNHFGGEQLGKILINDLDNKIKKVMKWTGSTPLYLCQKDNDSKFYKTSVDNEEEIKQVFEYGEDIGYILTDFVYPGELVGNAGDTVVTILDQIKNVLGNYEYFYDLNGNFVFQEIKNYLNTSYSTSIIKEISKEHYQVDYAGGKSVYTFEDGEIIKAYNNAPQYQLIKNDFVVWGKRKTTDGAQIPIRYHLAIDSKPQTGNKYKAFFYVDPDDNIEKVKKPLIFKSKSDFPEKGSFIQYYYVEDEDLIYKWNEKEYLKTDYSIQLIKSADWRTDLYMAGVESDPLGLDSNYYYTQLKNEWPKLYDLKNEKFFDSVVNRPSDIDFFLDFIDSSTAFSRFSIQNIGQRTETLVDDSINCIFEPEYPDLVVIETDTDDTKTIREDCEKRGQEYVQVSSEIYSLLAGGGSLRSAFEEIRKELYQYTIYNEQISLTTLLFFYLEPNSRITVRDTKSGIYGDYMIKSISLPLDINGTMSMTCVKALERI